MLGIDKKHEMWYTVKNEAMLLNSSFNQYRETEKVPVQARLLPCHAHALSLSLGHK